MPIKISVVVPRRRYCEIPVPISHGSGCSGLMKRVSTSAMAPFPGRSFFLFLAILQEGELKVRSEDDDLLSLFIGFSSLSCLVRVCRLLIRICRVLISVVGFWFPLSCFISSLSSFDFRCRVLISVVVFRFEFVVFWFEFVVFQIRK